jgi:uncharacterized protein YozE (UPF0346 family)
MTRSSFHKYMTAQVDREDPIGDLARDMRDDRNWPAGRETRQRLLNHLVSAHACEDALTVFDAAWKEYEESLPVMKGT